MNFSENPPVTALEAVKTGLFSDPIPTFAPDDTVQMYICRDEYAEAESCFGRLKELVKDEGLRYRDIAVVYRNEQDYLLPIAAAAEKFEIPYCVDGGLPPQTEPLFLVCVALLKSAFVQFSAIDLLTILRSGLFAVTDEDAAQLEEYLNVWRPSSVADWSRPFTARLSGYEADEFGGDTPLGDAPELLRKRLMDLLIPLRKKSEATGREYGALLYDILGKSGILEQFARRMQQSDLEEQLHAKRVWASFDDILTRLSDTLAEEVVSGAVYERLFVQSVKESRIKSVVQTMDCVMVGSADQIRLHEPRVMWILGANDGIFPKRPAAMNGLFTDAECKAFSELDLTVGKTLEERIAEERFIAYQMLCAPQERLYVSCRAADLGGGRQLAGEILWRMKVMFGSEPKDGALPESAYMTTAAAAFDAYCALARNDPEQASKYLDLLKKMPDNPYQTALAAVEKLLSPKRYLLSEPQTVERLYTLYERMLSPSEIEQYFRCPFAYFVKYGLKLRVKERAVYNPLLRGNLLHHVIAALTLPLSQMAKTDATQAAQTGEAIAPEQVKARISRMVEEAFTAELAALFDEPGRICAKDKALAQGMQLRVTRIAENIYAEQMQSKFRVFAVECDVGGGAIAPLSIPVGKKQVRIRGRIDRLDTYTEQGQTFFRIIDYKTGDKKFEYAKLMNGEHLQMILYEMAVSAGGRGGFANLVPAGVLYYPAREAAYLSDQETSEEEYRAHLDSSYCMNGILVDERETLSRVRAMEETLSQRYIPVGLNKRNQFDDQSLRSEEEYRRIEQYVGIQVRRMATEVSCGEIAPAYLVDREPCKYCSYAALCGSDLRTESIGREKISEQEAKDSILGQEETTWD